jgi:hypothetical protein
LIGSLALVGAPATGRVAAQDGGLTAAVHTGSCELLGDAVSQLRPLQAQGEGESAVQTSFTTIDVSLAELIAGGYAIAVNDGATVVACGDVAGPSGNDVFLGLREQNAAGYSGIAWLHARGNQTQVSIFLAHGLGGAAPEEDDLFPPPPPVETPTTEPTPVVVEPTPTSEPTADLVTYVSPSYGYQVRYDQRAWQKVDESSQPGQAGPVDYLALSNGLSLVEFLALPADPGVTAFDCIAFWQRNLSSNERVTDFQPRPGEEGGTQDQAFAAFDFTISANGQPTPSSIWVGCYQLPNAGAILAVLHQVPQRAYDQQAPAREQLLQGLTLA